MAKLSGSQLKQLHEALISAFPEKTQLAAMVRYGEVMDNLNRVAGTDDLDEAVYLLLQWAEARDLIDTLVEAAQQANPTSSKLQRIAETLELASPLIDPQEIQEIGGYERVIHKGAGFADVEGWQQRMGECTLAVCRVEIPVEEGMGTGFLVAPNLLFTNFHVMEKIIKKPRLREVVGFRFDFRLGAGKNSPKRGKLHQISKAEDWLVDSSPEEELDYALMRLEDSAGNEFVGPRELGRKRNWLTLKPRVLQKGEPLLIIQHPNAAPMKVSLGAVNKLDKANHWIFYSNNTEPGSSGSPCFDANWNLVALHHYGSKSSNRGIDFSAILEQPKVKAALGL